MVISTSWKIHLFLANAPIVCAWKAGKRLVLHQNWVHRRVQGVEVGVRNNDATMWSTTADKQMVTRGAREKKKNNGAQKKPSRRNIKQCDVAVIGVAKWSDDTANALRRCFFSMTALLTTSRLPFRWLSNLPSWILKIFTAFSAVDRTKNWVIKIPLRFFIDCHPSASIQYPQHAWKPSPCAITLPNKMREINLFSVEITNSRRNTRFTNNTA